LQLQLSDGLTGVKQRSSRQVARAPAHAAAKEELARPATTMAKTAAKGKPAAKVKAPAVKRVVKKPAKVSTALCDYISNGVQ
jgi:hypothetical protein